MKTLKVFLSVALCLSPLVSVAKTVGETAPLNGISSSLTVYVYPPRKPLNWESPFSVLRSFIDIEIWRSVLKNSDIKFESDTGEEGSISSSYRSTMGHTLAHVQCVLPSGETYNRWSSFSGQDYTEVDKKNLLEDKMGLGVLFYNYVDGHIISGEENIKRITHYKGGIHAEGRAYPKYLQYEITSQACDDLKKMITYFERFSYNKGLPLSELMQRPAEDVLYFTNQMDPYDTYLARMRSKDAVVGGGCAPYGAALVKMAGRYEPSYDQFWRLPVQVSEYLIGGINPTTGQKHEVNLIDLVLGRTGLSWTYEGYPNREVNMYDPQKIWDFTGHILNCLSGKSCDQSVSTWMQTTPQKLERGQTAIFRDQLEVVFKSQPTSKGEKIIKNIEQKVDGVILRL